MSKSKQKGTVAESALADYLRFNGYPNAERRALTGANDQGDIAGTGNLVWEVKNQRTYKIPEWLEETIQETTNAGADFGFLIIKPNGIGLKRVNDWWAVMNVDDLLGLLARAGYGSQDES